MAYNEGDANRIRCLLAERNDVVEKRIVGGGLGFMISGHLCCGVSDRGLTVRVGPDARSEALAMPNVRPLEFGDRQASAFIVVDSDGYQTDAQLAAWIERGVRFVATL